MLHAAVSTMIDGVLGSMSTWKRAELGTIPDDDVVCPARAAQHPVLDDVRADQAGPAQPRLVLAASRAQAVRRAEAARRMRPGDGDVRIDGQAAAYRLRDHGRGSQGVEALAGRGAGA